MQQQLDKGNGNGIVGVSWLDFLAESSVSAMHPSNETHDEAVQSHQQLPLHTMPAAISVHTASPQDSSGMGNIGTAAATTPRFAKQQQQHNILFAGSSHEKPTDAESATAAAAPDSFLALRQFLALSRKNYILKKRNVCQSVCEILAPVLFVFLLYIGYEISLSTVKVIPATVYANQTLPYSLFVNSGAAISSTLLPNNALATALLNTTATADSNTAALFTQLFNYSGITPLPSFDTYVDAHLAIRAFVDSGGNSSSAQLRQELNTLSLLSGTYYNLLNLGKLSFAPDTAAVRSLVTALNSSNTRFAAYYDNIYATEAAAVAHALRENYTADADYNPLWPYDTRSWAVVSFAALDVTAGVIDYTIRMNYSTLPSSSTSINKQQIGLSTEYQVSQ